MHWKFPPQVGEIRDLKATIMCELHDKLQILKYDFNNALHKVENQPVGPSVILLEADKEGVYPITWYINEKIVFQHVITINNQVDKIITVSCDLLEADTKHSLWDAMSITSRTALFHLGDQAYQDGSYRRCLKVKNGPDVKKYYFQLYSNRYSETWKPHADLLANVSNYYMWDDHDIVNNIQLDKVSSDIIDVAIEAYDAYQQYFHVEDTFLFYSFSWYKYLDNELSTVALTIDRTTKKIPLQDIFTCIEDLDKINPIKKLILCFSSAPIPHPQGFYGELYKKIIGVGKFWPEEELELLYKWLFYWMGDREVIILGGDVHFGVHGAMRFNHLKIPILISSPITNQPCLDRHWAAKGMRGEIPLGDMMFQCFQSKARRCFGEIDLNTMETSIYFSRDKYPKNLIKYLKY